MDLTPEIAKVARVHGVLDSVKVWMEGQAARLKAAVDAAVALGATPEQVAPMVAEIDSTVAVADEVAGAIAQNP